MDNNKTIDCILKKIEEEQIQPKSRWQFRVHSILVWSLGLAVIVVGALVIAAAIYNLTHNGWEYRFLTHSSSWQFITNTLPYVWIVLAIAASYLAIRQLRRTPHGYKYSTLKLVAGSIFASLVLGSVAYAAGVGEVIDSKLGKHIPLHKPAIEIQRYHWSLPEQGRIMGTIIDQEGDMVMVETNFPEVTSIEISLENIDESVRAYIIEDYRYRILAYEKDEGQWVACLITPFEKSPELKEKLPRKPEQLMTMEDPECFDMVRAPKGRERIEGYHNKPRPGTPVPPPLYMQR